MSFYSELADQMMNKNITYVGSDKITNKLVFSMPIKKQQPVKKYLQNEYQLVQKIDTCGTFVTHLNIYIENDMLYHQLKRKFASLAIKLI
jgi:hypothetical protein